MEILRLAQSLVALSAPVGSVSHAVGPELFAAVREMHERYPDPRLSSRELAQECGMGILSFHWRFRSFTGNGPGAYLRDLRCRFGAELLKDTRLEVREIARRCGYADPRRFSADFRREMGLCPQAWRAGFPDPYGS